MKWYAAHRNAFAFGKSDVEKFSRQLRILEKEFIEVAEAKQQERVWWQRTPDALILLHHRRKRHGSDLTKRLEFGQVRENCPQRRRTVAATVREGTPPRPTSKSQPSR